MKTWYQTNEAGVLSHRGQAIKPNKKILLSEEQAALHGDKIKKAEAPTEASEAGVAIEYEEWLSNPGNVAPKPQPEIEDASDVHDV